MSKKTEVAARRAALGLRVISNDIEINCAPTSMIKSVSANGIPEITSAPARSKALVTTSASPMSAPATSAAHSPAAASSSSTSPRSAPVADNAIDTSIAYANHCNDGHRITASDIGKSQGSHGTQGFTARPRTALERANGRLSLVPMTGHSAAS